MIVFEINATNIKALWGRTILKEPQISGIVVKQLKTDTLEEIEKTVSSILDINLYKKYKPLALCMPRDQVILRNLKFPAKGSQELEDIISLHLTQEVPYSREEIIYNYSVLEKEPSGFSYVLLGILHRQKLIKQFSVFERLNYYPENVLLSTFGVLNFLCKAKAAKENDTRLKACLDIGDRFSDFFLFRGNKVLFSKSIPMEGFQLNDDKQLNRFMSQIKQAMVVSRAGRTENLSVAYISGMGPERPYLERKVSDIFQVPVQGINPLEMVPTLKPFKNIDNIIGHTSISAMLGIAVSPLSSRFNLILPEAKLRKNIRETTKNLFVLGGVIIYIIVIMLMTFMGKIYNRQSYLNKLSAEINIMEHANIDTKKALDRIKVLRKFTKYKESVLYYYYELAKMIPEDITINRLLFVKNKEFSMVGEGADMGEIFKFVRELNHKELFGEAELRYSRKATKQGREYNEFNIVCHVK
ncbi:MAG: pilus assembly protein PilM [Candidatus Omnitrophota bacterium]